MPWGNNAVRCNSRALIALRITPHVSYCLIAYAYSCNEFVINLFVNYKNIEASSMQTVHLTAVIHKEDDMFVSLCPELDIASQGGTIEEAKANLKEAVELFYECASPNEIEHRYISESFISPLEVAVG